LTRFFNTERTKAAGNSRVSGPARIKVQRGFSLVELMFSMFILLLVISVAFDQIMQLQKKAASESSRLDMSQEAREFIDQTVHDLHLAGYPKASMFAAVIPLTDARVAAGIVNVSPTQLIFEGDINNDGQVYSVQLVYVPSDPADPNCPCIRRHVSAKLQGIAPSNQPPSTNYVETEHVMPPGQGNGQSGEDLFAFYDQNGNQIDVSAGLDLQTDAQLPPGQQIIPTISTVKVNLSLLSPVVDPATRNAARTALSGTVRVNQ
jgi:prepilin-type N-terminal cleavage/methylation domain-containing protein